MSTIKILGSGCANCRRLTALTEQAVAELGLDAQILEVTDYGAIAAYGVLTTPALVIDDQVAIAGRIPGLEALEELLAERLRATSSTRPSGRARAQSNKPTTRVQQTSSPASRVGRPR